MKTPYFLAISSALLLMFTACQKEEKPADARDRNMEEQNRQLFLGSNYEQQIWFSLENDEIIRENIKTDWDLKIETQGKDPYIYLNSALLMQVAVTSHETFENVNSSSGLDFQIDHPSGNRDSLALGRWWENQDRVYILNRGFDADGREMGYVKLQLSLPQEGNIHLRVSKLDGSNDFSVEIAQKSKQSMISFDQATEVDISPETGAYDLLFTQYTHMFYDPFMPYLVTGVILAPGVEATLVKDIPFAEFTFEHISGLSFSQKWDAIGYDWKEYSFDTGLYEILTNRFYVIQTANGRYFKLQFLDFYNTMGVRAYPMFVFQEIGM